jgi:hypothetical protein
MILYTTGYLFVVLATLLATLKWVEHENWQDWAASAICGLIWPLYLSVALIRRIIK